MLHGTVWSLALSATKPNISVHTPVYVGGLLGCLQGYCGYSEITVRSRGYSADGRLGEGIWLSAVVGRAGWVVGKRSEMVNEYLMAR